MKRGGQREGLGVKEFLTQRGAQRCPRECQEDNAVALSSPGTNWGDSLRDHAGPGPGRAGGGGAEPGAGMFQRGMLRRDLSMGLCTSPKTWGEYGRILSLQPPKPPASNSLPGSWNDAPSAPFTSGQPEWPE